MFSSAIVGEGFWGVRGIVGREEGRKEDKVARQPGSQPYLCNFPMKAASLFKRSHRPPVG